MNETLTPFQLWTLFLMFDNPSGRYTRRDLLLSCCDSAIRALSTKAVDADLSSLRSSKYIDIAGFVDGVTNNTTYRISDEGILYVRQNLSYIQDSCRRGTIPESIIRAQDTEIVDALRSNSPSLPKMIIDHGIQNIGNVFKLFEACAQLGA